MCADTIELAGLFSLWNVVMSVYNDVVIKLFIVAHRKNMLCHCISSYTYTNDIIITILIFGLNKKKTPHIDCNNMKLKCFSLFSGCCLVSWWACSTCMRTCILHIWKSTLLVRFKTSPSHLSCYVLALSLPERLTHWIAVLQHKETLTIFF